MRIFRKLFSGKLNKVLLRFFVTATGINDTSNIRKFHNPDADVFNFQPSATSGATMRWLLCYWGNIQRWIEGCSRERAREGRECAGKLGGESSRRGGRGSIEHQGPAADPHPAGSAMCVAAGVATTHHHHPSSLPPPPPLPPTQCRELFRDTQAALAREHTQSQRWRGLDGCEIFGDRRDLFDLTSTTKQNKTTWRELSPGNPSGSNVPKQAENYKRLPTASLIQQNGFNRIPNSTLQITGIIKLIFDRFAGLTAVRFSICLFWCVTSSCLRRSVALNRP